MQSAELITRSRDPLTRSCDLFVFDLRRGAFIGPRGDAAAIIRALVPYAKFSRPSAAPLYAPRFSRKCRVPVHALPCISSFAHMPLVLVESSSCTSTYAVLRQAPRPAAPHFNSPLDFSARDFAAREELFT